MSKKFIIFAAIFLVITIAVFYPLTIVWWQNLYDEVIADFSKATGEGVKVRFEEHGKDFGVRTGVAHLDIDGIDYAFDVRGDFALSGVEIILSPDYGSAGFKLLAKDATADTLPISPLKLNLTQNGFALNAMVNNLLLRDVLYKEQSLQCQLGAMNINVQGSYNGLHALFGKKTLVWEDFLFAPEFTVSKKLNAVTCENEQQLLTINDLYLQLTPNSVDLAIVELSDIAKLNVQEESVRNLRVAVMKEPTEQESYKVGVSVDFLALNMPWQLDSPVILDSVNFASTVAPSQQCGTPQKCYAFAIKEATAQNGTGKLSAIGDMLVTAGQTSVDKTWIITIDDLTADVTLNQEIMQTIGLMKLTKLDLNSLVQKQLVIPQQDIYKTKLKYYNDTILLNEQQIY